MYDHPQWIDKALIMRFLEEAMGNFTVWQSRCLCDTKVYLSVGRQEMSREMS